MRRIGETLPTMNLLLRLIVLLVAVISPLLVAAEKAPLTAAAPVEIGPDVCNAWDALQVADATLGKLIAQSQLADVASQTRIVKESVGTILRGIPPPDEASVRRLVSAGREVIALADHLADVAASGNRARADVVYANLHKYVDFVRKRLPPGGLVPVEGTPSS